MSIFLRILKILEKNYENFKRKKIIKTIEFWKFPNKILKRFL